MYARSSAIRVLVRAALVVGAVFAVTILLAAMPGHNAPSIRTMITATQEGSTSQETSRDMPGMDHSQMHTDGSAEKASEKAAVTEMNHMHGGAHMHMTEMRQQTLEDVKRANQIVEQLRAGMEKYRDYHVALNEGFRSRNITSRASGMDSLPSGILIRRSQHRCSIAKPRTATNSLVPCTRCPSAPRRNN